MKNLLKVWNNYYASTNKDTAIRDENFFSLEIEAITSNLLKEIINKNKKLTIRILELGSGTGFLASKIASLLTKNKVKYHYLGIDFSDVGIQKANKREIDNCTFLKDDFLHFLKSNQERFDFIITQRTVMAIMEKKSQKQLLKLIRKSLSSNGCGLLSECSIQALEEIQKLRKLLGILPLKKVWHSQYLDERFLLKVFSNIKVIDFSSTYWLITRVVYPFFEEPKHNTMIHKFAAKLVQTGNYGLVKLFVVRP